MEKKKLILCDTNVVINAFHEQPDVLAEFDKLGFERCAIASATAAEVFFGMRKNERRRTIELVRRFKVIHFDKAISLRMLRYQFEFANRLSVADSIVGATAVEYQFPLWTDNQQDFNFLPGVKFHRLA